MRLVVLSATVAALFAAACTEPAASTPPAEAAEGATPADPATTESSTTETPAAAPPLEAYVGKYPFDAVDGVVFLDHPLVRAGFEGSGAPAEAYALARSDNSTAVPIFRTETALVAFGFDRRTGGSVNWNIALTPDGRHATVCYQEEPIGHAYENGQRTYPVEPSCASDAATAEDQLFEWPSS